MRHWIRLYNLPEETTEDMLETWVQDVANVSGKSMLAKKEGTFVGWCWLCFENKQDADTAIGAINGNMFKNNAIIAVK